MSKRYSTYLPALVYVIDLFLLNISFFCAHLLLSGYHSLNATELIFFLLGNFSWSTVSFLAKSFRTGRPLSIKSNLNRFLTTLIYHLVFVLIVIQLLGITSVPKTEAMLTYLLFCIAIIIARSVLFFILDVLRKKGYNNRRVLILGDHAICKRITSNLNNHPEHGYHIVRTICLDELDLLSAIELQAICLAQDLNEIYICYKQLDPIFLEELIVFAEPLNIKIKLVSDLSIKFNYTELVNYDGIPAILVSSKDPADHKIVFAKRVFDVVFSSAVMVLGSPVFVALLLITKSTSPGKAFYKQERIGLNGKPFHMYKFRSMHVNAETSGPQLSSINDMRITKWGKIMRETRLDELPQFYNVLKGDMSVVGPRPERQFYIKKILERTPGYQSLLMIKPGITSIGQVNYGYAGNIDELCARVTHDLCYLNKMTINTDLQIILKTVRVMVQRKGK